MSTVLAVARQMVESRMPSTCTITPPGGEPVWNEGTGTYVPPGSGTPVYTGKCRVKAPTTSGRETDAGEYEVLVTTREIHVPATVTGVEIGHVVTITASDTAGLVGRRFVVFDDGAGDETSALRLVCREVS